MIDAKHGSALSHRHTQAADLRREIPRRNAGHHDQRRKAVEVRHAGPDGVTRNLGVVPHDRKRDWSIAQNAEVVGVVRVLPKIFGIYHQILSECLLETSMELIPKAWR